MQVAVPKTEQEVLDLIDAALRGEEVVIESENRAAIKLVPIPDAGERPRFVHGIRKMFSKDQSGFS